jgi:serine protease Do
VVQGADEVTVTLSDKRQLTAEIVGTDKATDVAVLKVEATNLHPAKLGDSSTLQVGEWALAVGSPFGLDQTVTAGIISAVGRANVGITDYEDFIQTDAAINPGNSGGPLVNLKGEVIGINTAIASRNGAYQGVGFAIPSEMAQHVMESIISHGTVTRGFLGAYIQPLTQELAGSFGFDSTQGVLIGDVTDGGPADKAGLQESEAGVVVTAVDPTGLAARAGVRPGDIIVSIAGKPIRSLSDFRETTENLDPRSGIRMQVMREGIRQFVFLRSR